MNEMKTFYADVTYKLYNVEFKASPDTSEAMLEALAEEAAADKLMGPGPDSVEVELEDEE